MQQIELYSFLAFILYDNRLLTRDLAFSQNLVEMCLLPVCALKQIAYIELFKFQEFYGLIQRKWFVVQRFVLRFVCVLPATRLKYVFLNA